MTAVSSAIRNKNVSSGGWRGRQKKWCLLLISAEENEKKKSECGCGCTYRQIGTRKLPVVHGILGSLSGILSRRTEYPHFGKQKDGDLTEGQDAINT